MKTKLHIILIAVSALTAGCAQTEFRVHDAESTAAAAESAVPLTGAPGAGGTFGPAAGTEPGTTIGPGGEPGGDLGLPFPIGGPAPTPLPTPPAPGAAYSWVAGAYGACSATSQVTVGAWSECENLTCDGGEQRRTVSCTPRAGTQTRAVRCVRQDGVTVADAHCAGLKPATTQSCQSSCATADYPTRQACVKGTPCRYSFTTQYLVSDANNPHRNHSKCSALAHVQTGYHGVRCYNPFKKGQGGDVKAVAYNGGNGRDATTWNLKHPGDCAQGYAVEIHNAYACLGVCRSGQWVEVGNTIGSPRVSPLTGDLESPLSNPWAHPENTNEVAGRNMPHYRCVGQE